MQVLGVTATVAERSGGFDAILANCRDNEGIRSVLLTMERMEVARGPRRRLGK